MTTLTDDTENISFLIKLARRINPSITPSEREAMEANGNPDEDFQFITLPDPGSGHNSGLKRAADLLLNVFDLSEEDAEDHLGGIYQRDIADVRRVIKRVRGGVQSESRPKFPARDNYLIAAAANQSCVTVEDLKRRSPGTLETPAADVIALLMREADGEDPLVCIGTAKNKFSTKPLSAFKSTAHEYAFIVPQPMTSTQGETKDGHLSAKSDANTSERSNVVVEFDTIASKDTQAALLSFLAGYAPLLCVGDSGRKSLHGYFDVAGRAHDEKQRFMRAACLLGADKALWTLSQFARIPGGTRPAVPAADDAPAKPAAHQALLYLDPDAPRKHWRLEELEKWIRSHLASDASTDRVQMLLDASECSVDLTKFDSNDHGNAERVHAYAGSNFRHIIESGQWIVWDGFRWVPDANGGMTRLFVSVMKQTGKQAFDIPDRSRADPIVKHAFKSRDAAKVQSGLQMLKAIFGVSISVNDLDADPWLIGTEDGVIDLKLGKPITPDRSKLITKKIGARYDKTAACPTWERFLHTVTGGDTELIRFLQSAVGYTLTGSNTEQCLFFLHGTGQNGKGVFSETIKRLFGNYGQVAPESMFVNDRNRSATNDIARLAGCRLAVASELGEGAAFAESRVKALTGNDMITARFLHREFFDFEPTHHFWISGNHKPTIQGNDFGIWRRIRLIPFTIRISEAEKDPDLICKLTEEMPGILNWALAGCLRWQREGLHTPGCVTRATAEYRSEEDIIGQFLDECTTEDPTARVLTRILYDEFHRWSLKGGTKCPIRSKDFGRRIDDKCFQRLASNGGRYWLGLSLREFEELD